MGINLGEIECIASKGRDSLLRAVGAAGKASSLARAEYTECKRVLMLRRRREKKQ